jgi:iron complex transport system permease protein
MFVYTFARRGGLAPMRLILAGVATQYALTGVTNYTVLQADDPGRTNSALFWLFGSLGGARWSVQLAVLAAGVAAAGVALAARSRAINALSVGDETATSLGVSPAGLRRELFVVIALLTGLLVAATGVIGFVGLLVPHAGRLLVGADHRRLLPVVALLGPAFLVSVDLLARYVLRPQELPIGIITSVLGAPAFLALLHRRRKEIATG